MLTQFSYWPSLQSALQAAINSRDITLSLGSTALVGNGISNVHLCPTAGLALICIVDPVQSPVHENTLGTRHTGAELVHVERSGQWSRDCREISSHGRTKRLPSENCEKQFPVPLLAKNSISFDVL